MLTNHKFKKKKMIGFNYQKEMDDKRRFDERDAKNLLIGGGSAEEMREKRQKGYAETKLCSFGFLHFWRRERCYFIYSWALAQTDLFGPKHAD